MSQKPRVIVAVLAAAATLAAVQIAASQSASTATLADRFEAASERPTVEPWNGQIWSGPIWDAAGINRTAKGNRDAVPRGAAPSRTVLLKSDPLANTSVLVRFPRQNDARYLSPAPLAKPASAKMVVACEPVVSLLTEVAKLLQPGKCVT